MIDIHCHILPGVPGDDGSPDLDTSLKMLEAARADGIDTIICTPHGKQPIEAQTPIVSRILEDFRPKAEEYGIKLIHGVEYNLPHLLQVDRKTAVPLAGSKYLLVDFVRNRLNSSLDIISHEIYTNHFKPICAHPERLFGEWGQVQRVYDHGFTMQLTAKSIIGGFGRTCQKFSFDLLDHGLCHYIASDAHNTDRLFHMKECRELIKNKYGEESARILFEDNPQRLLNNEDPLEIDIVSDDYDEDIPKNPIMRFIFKHILHPGYDRDDY